MHYFSGGRWSLRLGEGMGLNVGKDGLQSGTLDCQRPAGAIFLREYKRRSVTEILDTRLYTINII